MLFVLFLLYKGEIFLFPTTCATTSACTRGTTCAVSLVQSPQLVLCATTYACTKRTTCAISLVQREHLYCFLLLCSVLLLVLVQWKLLVLFSLYTGYIQEMTGTADKRTKMQ